MNKKILCLALSAAMVLSQVSPVFADGDAGTGDDSNASQGHQLEDQLAIEGEEGQEPSSDENTDSDPGSEEDDTQPGGGDNTEPTDPTQDPNKEDENDPETQPGDETNPNPDDTKTDETNNSGKDTEKQPDHVDASTATDEQKKNLSEVYISVESGNIEDEEKFKDAFEKLFGDNAELILNYDEDEDGESEPIRTIQLNAGNLDGVKFDDILIIRDDFLNRKFGVEFFDGADPDAINEKFNQPLKNLYHADITNLMPEDGKIVGKVTITIIDNKAVVIETEDENGNKTGDDVTLNVKLDATTGDDELIAHDIPKSDIQFDVLRVVDGEEVYSADIDEDKIVEFNDAKDYIITGAYEEDGKQVIQIGDKKYEVKIESDDDLTSPNYIVLSTIKEEKPQDEEKTQDKEKPLPDLPKDFRPVDDEETPEVDKPAEEKPSDKPEEKEEKPSDKSEEKEEKPSDKPGEKEEKPSDKSEEKEEKPSDKPEEKEDEGKTEAKTNAVNVPKQEKASKKSANPKTGVAGMSGVLGVLAASVAGLFASKKRKDK